jgi:hypothetical protein
MSAAVSAILGVSEVTGALLSTAAQLAAGARRIDDGAATRMVERMKADAPVRTGRLQAGITAQFADGVWTVKAEARDPAGRKGGAGEGAEYATFVEFGTDPRSPGRAAADAGFFAGQSRSGHPGTDPQPFFWDNARAELGKRFADAKQLAGGLEADF